MAALMFSHRGATRLSAPQRTTRSARIVLARSVEQETKQTQTNIPDVDLSAGLDFTASRQGGEGYVEKDTAGQSNMYPTVTRPFEVGSEQDTVANSGFNTSVAVGAAVLGVGLVVAGLVAQTGAPATKTAEVVVPSAEYQSLSSYASKFAAELAPAPAPPVAVEQVAEAVVPEEAPAPELAVAVEAQ